jgi:hypothetical protein
VKVAVAGPTTIDGWQAIKVEGVIISCRLFGTGYAYSQGIIQLKQMLHNVKHCTGTSF